MMKKSWILVTFIFLISFGCSNSKIDSIFPQEQLKGSVENFIISIGEPQTGKSVEGGMLVTAKVVLPPDVRNDQIRPTEMSILKSLKEQYPHCEWFLVWLSDDLRMLEVGQYLGQAEYKEGRLMLHGGVITDKDIAESGGKIWKPTEDDISATYEFHTLSMEIERDYSDKLSQLQSKGRWEEAKNLALKAPVSEEDIHAAVGKKLGASQAEISRRVKNTIICYAITRFRKI